MKDKFLPIVAHAVSVLFILFSTLSSLSQQFPAVKWLSALAALGAALRHIAQEFGGDSQAQP